MSTESSSQPTSSPGVVIVGGGLAAVRTAEQVRKSGDDRPITIVTEEIHPPYDRPPLSKDFLVDSDKGLAEVALKPADFYAVQGITLRPGHAATALDTGSRMLTLDDGSTLAYDDLVIATGLVPKRIASFPDLPGIRVLRSLDDALALREHAASARRVVIVGAGFIGCEVAASLRALGVNVVLVEPQTQPLAGVLGERVGELVARLHRGEGVDVRTRTGVAHVRGDHRALEVVVQEVVSSGDEPGREEVIDADLVVLGIGSRPATAWLAGSGVDLDPADGGVLCDEAGRTSAPHVWALGDVAAWVDAVGHRGRVEHWSNVAEQARVLVPAMLGAEPPAVTVVPYFWSDQYDVKIQCLGEPRATDAVHIAADDGRKFLAYYERDGILSAVVGGGMPGKVMKLRSKLVVPTAIGEVVG